MLSEMREVPAVSTRNAVGPVATPTQPGENVVSISCSLLEKLPTVKSRDRSRGYFETTEIKFEIEKGAA
jgi:hypothetical protein